MSTYADANPYMAKLKKEAEITKKQDRFIKEKIKGHSNKDAAILAGYSKRSAANIGQNLMHSERIMKALEDAGLTDKKIADVLNEAIEAGIGVKATNSDALKGIEMVAKLRGHLKQNTENNTQNNIFIQELNQMSDADLASKVAELTQQVQSLS
jgi:phage terminase small subunit